MTRQLLLSYDFPPIGGGIARWMGEMAKRFSPGSLIVSTGYHPDSSSTDWQFQNRIDRLSTRAHRLRTIQGLVRWSNRAAFLAQSSNVGFTWCGNIKPAGYPARWIAARSGIPYGIIVHGGDLLILQEQTAKHPFKRRTTRAIMKSASVMVANSAWTADLCRSVLRTLELNSSIDKVRVVPLGSDPDVFRPGIDTTEVRMRYGLNGRCWLLTVARLTAHKGIDTGLRVLAELCHSYPDLGYAVVGHGPELSALQAMAEQLGVADRVRFLTNVPDKDLPALYNCAQLYLGLSRQMARNVEGFGISLVEASACGIAIVAGRSGGISDAVRDGETGLLVDSQDPRAVAVAVKQLLEDPALARRLGAGGVRAVQTYYNWRRVAGDLCSIGQELGIQDGGRQ